MNSAPKKEEMSPTDLWVALTALPRPSREIPVPRNKEGTEEPIGTIRVWPLTQEEQMAANAEADSFTKKLLKDPQKKEEANLGYHHTFTNEMAVQVLFRACRDVDNIKRAAFPSPQLMRATFTTDEIGVMFNTYATVQSELGPIRAHMTTEETEGFILRLRDGGSAFPFDSISWEQQRSLVLGMACRLVDCWTAISSAGLPLAVSTFVLERLHQIILEESPKEDHTPELAEPDTTE